MPLKNLIHYAAKSNDLAAIGLHILLGLLFYLEPKIITFYTILVFSLGVFYIVKTKNSNHQVLQISAYVCGGEVLSRMLGGPSYEFAKYSILLFMALAFFYNGCSKRSWMYVLYLVLLVISLWLSNAQMRVSSEAIDMLKMNILAPVGLGFLSIYTYRKKVSFWQMSRIVLLTALPLVSVAMVIFLQNPDISSIGSVNSNPNFSGRFGPNQVATALGLGMFVFFARSILNFKSRLHFAIDLLLGSALAYLGLLTFSRGGMITGFCSTAALAGFLYLRSAAHGKFQSKMRLVAFAICFMGVFSLVSYQTHGLLLKRYTNRDHLGRTKKDKAIDRRAIAAREFKAFIDNPMTGASVAEAEKARQGKLTRTIHSHNEITRLLAEHGICGLTGLLILIITPVRLFLYQRKNVFLLAFFVFWLLTINHSGMRLIAPAFLYALMLLEVDVSKITFSTSKSILPNPEAQQNANPSST